MKFRIKSFHLQSAGIGPHQGLMISFERVPKLRSAVVVVLLRMSLRILFEKLLFPVLKNGVVATVSLLSNRQLIIGL